MLGQDNIEITHFNVTPYIKHCYMDLGLRTTHENLTGMELTP